MVLLEIGWSDVVIDAGHSTHGGEDASRVFISIFC